MSQLNKPLRYFTLGFILPWVVFGVPVLVMLVHR